MIYVIIYWLVGVAISARFVFDTCRDHSRFDGGDLITALLIQLCWPVVAFLFLLVQVIVWTGNQPENLVIWRKK